jgi:BirA family biotin operon repressor/biotin-[acetyl-CoA-carboxylase] ligase
LAERAQDKRGEPFVVLGMGVNVNLSEEDFPEDLQKSATSVALCSGGRIDFGAFFSLLLTALEECYLKMLR